MSDVFADTSFFLALLSSADKHHLHAQRLARARQQRLITTGWVMAELGNFLRRPAQRPLLLEILTRLQRDDTASILPADQASFDAGLDLFAERPDKDWSLTDCISMQVMRRMHIDEALTADRHFAQAGFRALLLE